MPGYKRALENNLGIGAMPRLEAQAAALAEFNASARVVHDNFMGMVRSNLQAP